MCTDAQKPSNQCPAFFHLSHHDCCFSNQKFTAFLANVFYSELDLRVWVWVHVLWDHSLCKLWGETTTDCTHWNPQTPVHDPSISPSLSLFSLPPTEHLVGSQTPVPPAIYPLPSSSTSMLSSIHLPPSHDLPNTYRPSVFVRCSPATVTAL